MAMDFSSFLCAFARLSRKYDVTQIAAYDGKEEFNCYLRPIVPISSTATDIIGLQYSLNNNQMRLNGQEVDSVDTRLGILLFIDYLSKRNKPLLVGHKIASYDVPILVRLLQNRRLLSEILQHNVGCVDTLKVAKRAIPKHEVTNYKQETLVYTFLNGKTYSAQNARNYVIALHELYVKDWKTFAWQKMFFL